MLPKNQRHLKNDCVDCKLQDYDNKNHAWTCLGVIIESNACVSCHHYKVSDFKKVKVS